MTVLVKKSICSNCIWINSCSSFKKIHEMRDSRDNTGHPNSVFDAIIVQCSMKDFDRSYKKGDDGSTGMYYCTKCNSMHHTGSRIGKLHRVQ